MSIRFIGYESYVPVEPGNYARGRTKTIKVSTLPNEHEKTNKTIKYRE